MLSFCLWTVTKTDAVIFSPFGWESQLLCSANGCLLKRHRGWCYLHLLREETKCFTTFQTALRWHLQTTFLVFLVGEDNMMGAGL